jgi:tetratricopeptide (TPR) repeat protein
MASQSRTPQMTGTDAPAFRVSPGLYTKTGLCLILAAIYFLYAPALGFQFVYDDVFQIVHNRHLDSWRFLPVYFTAHVWSHIPGMTAEFYRPLFLVWLRLNHMAFGQEPAGWHFTALLLHVAATALVYLLARTLLRSAPAALAAALIFGVLPVHVEAIAWISGATESLYTCLFVGALLCYFRRRSQTAPGSLWSVLSLTLFGAALLSKETAAVLPFVILAYELTLGRENPAASSAQGGIGRRLLPYWIVLAVYLAIRMMVLHGAVHRMTASPLVWSVLAWPWLLAIYLRLLVWPAGMSPLYDPIRLSGFGDPRLLLPWLAILLALVMAWRMARKSSFQLALFAASWFLLTLAPAFVISSVAAPDEAYHDRYLYLPSVALAVIVAAWLRSGWKHGGKAGRVLIAGALVASTVAMAAASHRQTAYWASDYTLFQRAAAIAPGNQIADLNYASQLLNTREYQRALQFSQMAVSLDPSARALASAAAAAFALSDYKQAEAYYLRAIQADPDRGDYLFYLGLTRMKLGNYPGAIEALRQATSVSPEMHGVHYGLGLAEAHLQHWPQAVSEFEKELQLNPDDTNVREALMEGQRHVKENQMSAAEPVSPSK